MRNLHPIDAELRLLTAVHQSIREQGGKPSSEQVNELLDERLAVAGGSMTATDAIEDQEYVPGEDLPDDFAIALGRLLYLGGRVEMLLDRCLVPAGADPPRLGLSGEPLAKELRKIAEPGSRLEEIAIGYAAMHEYRNHLVHGAHHYANRALWTWRQPIRAKGRALFSFTFRLEHLQDTAQSWQNLTDAVVAELEQRADSALSET